MNRREFMKGTAAAAAATAALSIVPDAMARGVERAREGSAPEKFKLRYAFDAGQFSNHAPGGVVDELKFAHDQGFSAMEDNRMKGRPVDEQEKIAREMVRLGMTRESSSSTRRPASRPAARSRRGSPKSAMRFSPR